MLKDYDEVFRALSAYSLANQNRMLDALRFTETGSMTDAEVESATQVWMSIPWSLVAEDQTAMAFRYAQHFERLVAQGADRDGGKVTITFAGLADDPRELWEIDEVRMFCRLMFTAYPPLLFALADEDSDRWRALCPDDAERYAAIPGRLFFTSLTAEPGMCWDRDENGKLRYFATTAWELRAMMVDLAASLRQ